MPGCVRASPIYAKQVTTKPPEDQQRWQQPAWDAPTADAESDPPKATIDFGEPLSGAVLVPATPAPPPSVIESGLTVIGAVAWPVAIALALFGVGGWWLNIVVVLVLSSLTSAIAGEMKKHRKRQ